MGDIIGYMATDQYGNTYHGLKNPRKDLMDRLGSKHAQKMYIDNTSGESKHIGYVISGHWLTVYAISEFK